MARITKTQRHKAAKPQPNGRAYSPPREEGWLRHQENFGEAHLSAADGVVAHESCSGVTDHPVRSNKEGFAAFSLCRVHPSSRRGDYARQKIFSKKQAMTHLLHKARAVRCTKICLDYEPLCLCVPVSLWLLKCLTVFAKNVKVDE